MRITSTSAPAPISPASQMPRGYPQVAPAQAIKAPAQPIKAPAQAIPAPAQVPRGINTVAPPAAHAGPTQPPRGSAPQPCERSAGIDILRGLCIIGMIFTFYPHPDGTSFAWLQPDRWAGCYIAEILFALFLFLSGASMACSLARREKQAPWPRLRYFLIRSLLLFALGFVINLLASAYPALGEQTAMLDSVRASWDTMPVYGLLQRLALCTLLCALLIVLLRLKVLIILAAAGLLALHGWILIHAIDSPESIAHAYTLQGQVASSIDLYLVSESSLDRSFGLPFDPFGLLSILSGSATLLLGYLSCSLLNEGNQLDKQLRTLSILSILCIGGALILSRDIPIVRPLWTSSYVLLTAGVSMGLLSVFSHFSRFPIVSLLFSPARVMGCNPLIAYLVSLIFSYVVGMKFAWLRDTPEGTLRSWLFDGSYIFFEFYPQGQLLTASILYSLAFTLVVLLPCLILTKMHIHVRAGFGN